MEPDAANAPVLPVTVIGLVDVGRLIRELEKLEQAMQANAIRGEATGENIRVTLLLEQLAEANSVKLDDAHARQSLLEFMRYIKKSAPRVHISFSADPSPVFLAKLMPWFRHHVHPHLLVAIGLQPGIGAGCVLRTTNRFFDMSLSQSFSNSRSLLMDRLRASGSIDQAGAPSTDAVSPDSGAVRA